jgi:hypothetical protein
MEPRAPALQRGAACDERILLSPNCIFQPAGHQCAAIVRVTPQGALGWTHCCLPGHNALLKPSLLNENPYRSRPCEERSYEAIQGQPSGSGLLRLRLAMTAGATTFWAVHI